jgi:hypothetical protein
LYIIVSATHSGAFLAVVVAIFQSTGNSSTKSHHAVITLDSFCNKGKFLAACFIPHLMIHSHVTI